MYSQIRKQCFFSGSHDTYLDCSCTALREYNKARDALHNAVQRAKDRLELMQTTEALLRAQRDVETLSARVTYLKTQERNNGPSN